MKYLTKLKKEINQNTINYIGTYLPLSVNIHIKTIKNDFIFNEIIHNDNFWYNWLWLRGKSYFEQPDDVYFTIDYKKKSINFKLEDEKNC